MSDFLYQKSLLNTKDEEPNEEKLFLKSYNIENFERPSVATDIVVFSMFAKSSECHRKDDEPELSVLLVKRGEHPYMNKWALPGGFLRSDETLEECALRELKEETNLSAASIIPVGVFSNPNRDPRGRIISNAFASIISEENVKLMSGTDAIQTTWFSVDFKLVDKQRYNLTLKNGNEKIFVELQQRDIRYANSKFDIVSNSGLAFDHAKIIATALSDLKEKAANIEFVFDFLPEKFTLASLQKVQETLLGISLLTANFRRKIADLVEETDESTSGAGHRPARLFTRRK